MSNDERRQKIESRTHCPRRILSVIDDQGTSHEELVGEVSYSFGEGPDGLAAILRRYVVKVARNEIIHVYKLLENQRPTGAQLFVDWEINNRDMRNLRITDEGLVRSYPNFFCFLVS